MSLNLSQGGSNSLSSDPHTLGILDHWHWPLSEFKAEWDRTKRQQLKSLITPHIHRYPLNIFKPSLNPHHLHGQAPSSSHGTWHLLEFARPTCPASCFSSIQWPQVGKANNTEALTPSQSPHVTHESLVMGAFPSPPRHYFRKCRMWLATAALDVIVCGRGTRPLWLWFLL